MASTRAPRKDWFKSLLVRLTSSPGAQQFLERHAQFTLELMGIGSGSSPGWSGEKGLGRLLRDRYARVRRPLCIFDVGASTGQFLSVLIPPLISASIPLNVHAFEPSAVAFKRLDSAFGGRPDISLNNAGLGRTAGEFELHSNAVGSSLASLSPRRLDHFGIDFSASEKVRLETLDGYCLGKGIDAIDLLKIDVEGHELEVLQGSLRMFGEKRVAMVSFEFGGADIDSRTFFQDFWYFFTDNHIGILHRITPSGRPLPITEYREIYEQFRNTNFLVIASD
jgi:FkbM family methyltransferase